MLIAKTRGLMVYYPPTRRAVIRKCAMVLSFVAFVSGWHLLGVPFFPRALPAHGLACLPADHDAGSTVFFWIVFLPAAAGIPAVYGSYVLYLCWRNILVKAKLAPRLSQWSEQSHPSSRSTIIDLGAEAIRRRSRQERALTAYFMRIVCSLLFLWVPAFAIIFMLPFRSPFAAWTGGTLAHLQGFVSAAMCMLKPDIRQAVTDLFVCRGASCSPAPCAPRPVAKICTPTPETQIVLAK